MNNPKKKVILSRIPLSKSIIVNQYTHVSDILSEYGLRNFLGLREGGRRKWRGVSEEKGGGRKGERRRHDTVRPWRTDVETIEARYTSESLFALMAYVWKREGRRERERGGSWRFIGAPLCLLCLRAPLRRAVQHPRAHLRPALVRWQPPCRLGDAACELKRLINIWNKGGRFRGRTPERYTAGYDGRHRGG